MGRLAATCATQTLAVAIVAGQLQRAGKSLAIRGLSPNHHHELNHIFKAAATAASVRPGPGGEPPDDPEEAWHSDLEPIRQ